MSQHSDANLPHRPYPRVAAYPPKPRRHRPVNPYAAANDLAMQHMDIAEKVAGNISRKTGHPIEDLRQIAMMGIIQASRRYIPEQGDFRKYARTYANGEVYHFLRDKGFPIKVPPSWREKYSKGKRLLENGRTLESTIRSLGVSIGRWQEIALACTQKVVCLQADE
jgi:RNA polymerase sigma-B factor